MTINIEDKKNPEVESEDNENLDIKVPFDPNLIKVTTKPMTLGEIVDMVEHNELNLFTEYQRLPGLWDVKKQSRLIESILLRLPLPNFYFDGSDENLWGVVDGLQRISTLKNFIIDKSLKLEKLEFLFEYDGKGFEDLPRPYQRRIMTFPVTAYIIEKGTPDVVKYNIFSRINQGGLKLEPQEIRHALHQGKPAELIADLVRGMDDVDKDGNVIKSATEEGKIFVQVTEGKIGINRMQDRDFANRFVSFYLIPYQEYEPDLDSFMNKGMGLIKRMTDAEIQQMRTDFKDALALIYLVFGNDAFRKRLKQTDPRKPINKAIFEVFTVLFAKLSEAEKKIIGERSEVLKALFQEYLKTDKDRYLQAVSTGTALKNSVEIRFSKTEEMIKKTLGHA